MPDETTEFLDQLGSAAGFERRHETQSDLQPTPPSQIMTIRGGMCQWQVAEDGKFTPGGPTVSALPSGVYKPEWDGRFDRLVLEQRTLMTDTLITLADGVSHRVLHSIQHFWMSRERFHHHGQLFKRGILLWGPAGSGKTTTVIFLIQDLIARDGIVLLADNAEITSMALKVLRKIEPQRSFICILEDLDELIMRSGQATYLSLLDGENQIDNVVYLATTNYPERLDPRFVNRPSRFDEVIKIGMPSAAARQCYLRARLSLDEMSDAVLAATVHDTEGFSIAHLRELIVAVFCLQRGYQETLVRLRSMQRLPSTEDLRQRIGIGTNHQVAVD